MDIKFSLKFLACLICLIGMTAAKAQQFTVLKSFDAAHFVTGIDIYTNFDGGYPGPSLILCGNTLYGAAQGAGRFGSGTVFKMNTDGTGFTVLTNFNGNSDGDAPAVTLCSSNILYGTARGGGTFGKGTLFKINTDGTGFAVLYNFTNSITSSNPCPGLILSGGVLYGTTYGGTSIIFGSAPPNGTIFKINTDGTGYAVLKNFQQGGSDGAGPESSLTLCSNTLYGTTTQGGSSGHGTIFKINTDGTNFAVLRSFTNLPDAQVPITSPFTLSGNTLYGTTYYGGTFNHGTVYRINTDGTGYAILYSFQQYADGQYPSAGLTLLGSTLYGTTSEGGLGNNGGTVFQINTDGSNYAVLNNFAIYGGNGSIPITGLALSGSILYGMTGSGGSNNDGAIYSLNLAPVLTAQLQNAQVSLQLTGTPNYSYLLQAVTNLAPPLNWQLVYSNSADANGNWQFTDTNPGCLQKWYRAVRP